MIPLIVNLKEGKKVYFASDFHLGVPDKSSSLTREKKIIRWLNLVIEDAQVIFLVGDIFDFWFEYKYTIPKGYTRLLGKLAEITDKGIQLIAFSGNHDMWMFKYFEEEFNMKVYHTPQVFKIGAKTLYIGHGDGLGPGDHFYKILKRIFRNKICIKLFSFLHPDIGIFIANFWSRKSRVSQSKKEEFLGDDEWLFQYCNEVEKSSHHDFYIFGHRHLPLNLEVSKNSQYINLGEWINYCTYAIYDGSEVKLLTFE